MGSKISNSFSNIAKIISLLLVTIISLSSCSSKSPYNPFYNVEDEVKKDTVSKLVKCPKAFLPKETSYYKSLYDLQTISFKIKKLELTCALEDNKGELKNLQINYKAYIHLDKFKSKKKKTKFPDIFLVIVNEYSENIILKVLSQINNKNTQKDKLSNEFIHKNSFRINYKNKLDYWNIYVGFQKKLNSIETFNMR